MKELPESILYGTRFVFLVAITLMTPFCSLLADILNMKCELNGIWSIIAIVTDILLFLAGLKVLLLNHGYIIEKEIEYELYN